MFRTVKVSLADLLGSAYTDAVCEGRAALTGEKKGALKRAATQKVDLFPKAMQQRLTELLPRVGSRLAAGLSDSSGGATSAAFEAHSSSALAPLSGFGYYRLGEDGRLFFSSKSAHYHAPLGHAFPGYTGLLHNAKLLGIPNATHNNTRGHITRLLETELVRCAAGIAKGDDAELGKVLKSRAARVLNRVLNLETGSLAAEAALKMVLARFYRPETSSEAPKYAGRTPVLLVLGDDDGGNQANYHGTTVLTQMMRDMWPGLAASMEKNGQFMVRSVRPNDLDELERVFKKYEGGRTKIAGFFHELVLMNYAAKRLSKQFVRRAYALCRKNDVPTVVDEIQTGLWASGLYLFHEYGVRPDIVVLGKGFPGGEFAASKVLFGAKVDCLSQFGALVTNGQEEIASLAYLITMRWAEANAGVTKAVGEYYAERLSGLVGEFPALVSEIEGSRHLAGVYFHDLEPAVRFAKSLNGGGFDVSVQTYKAGCPPCALTKLPLIAGYEAVDFLVERMRDALRRL